MLVILPQYCHLTILAALYTDREATSSQENVLRFVSCLLSLIIVLTVMLSGIEGVQANVANSANGHHGMVSDMPVSSQHEQNAAHPDMCGMAVCGPFVQEVDGVWMAVPVVHNVKYWTEVRRASSAEIDVRVKTPRPCENLPF